MLRAPACFSFPPSPRARQGLPCLCSSFLFKPHCASASAARVALCAGRRWMTTKTRRKPATRTEPVRLTEKEKEEQGALVLKHQEWAKKLAKCLVRGNALARRLGLAEAEGVAVTALWRAVR